MAIVTCSEINLNHLIKLLNKYDLIIETVEPLTKIPGSWFGDSEAGIIKNTLYIRPDTPVHSALHESCHYICMDKHRRKKLHTNAGGDYTEEDGVCYLQILLAGFIEDFGQNQILKDMDEWGYSFRLGSSKAWFYEDAEDAKDWLIKNNIINENNQPTFLLRH